MSASDILSDAGLDVPEAVRCFYEERGDLGLANHMYDMAYAHAALEALAHEVVKFARMLAVVEDGDPKLYDVAVAEAARYDAEASDE